MNASRTAVLFSQASHVATVISSVTSSADVGFNISEDVLKFSFRGGLVSVGFDDEGLTTRVRGSHGKSTYHAEQIAQLLGVELQSTL